MASEWGVLPQEIDERMTAREIWMYLSRIVERHQRRSKAQSSGDEPMNIRRFISQLSGKEL